MCPILLFELTMQESKTNLSSSTASISARPLMSLKDVRSRLGNVSRTWIWLETKENRFPKPFKVGNRLRWDPTVIDQWIEQRQAAAS